MASGLERVIEHVQFLAAVSEANYRQDGQLLARFIASQDQASFTALVRKHGPMVLGVCRGVLGNHHDAEDAFQATFMILARKAACIRQSSLAAWLHTVAHRTALAGRNADARRRSHEKQMDKLPEIEMVSPEYQDWRPLLDSELGRLAEIHRGPVVLCDLEGFSRKEAARQLKIAEGTLSSRLNRARALLAVRLRQHGVMLSAATLGAAVSARTSCAVPQGLVTRTVKSILLTVVDRMAAPLTPAEVLVKGVSKQMLAIKLKGMAGIAVVIATLTATGYCCLSSSLAAAQPETLASITPSHAPKAGDQQKVQADLLAKAIQGHRANLKAIRSLYAELWIRTDGKNSTRILTGKWWQEGDRIRFEEQRVDDQDQATGPREDYLLDGKKTFRLTSQIGNWGQTHMAGRITQETMPHGSFLDPWSRMGFTDQYSSGHFVGEMLEDSSWTKSVRNRMEEKEGSLEVVCQKGPRTIKLEMIPNRGYLVKRMEILEAQLNKEPNFRSVLEMDGIEQCAPGVFFPTHSVRTIHVGTALDQLLARTESYVDVLIVNQPLAKNTFEPLIPEGVRVWDLIKQEMYTMGPDGNPSPNDPITLLKNGNPVKKKP
jgi:RNA polymerase sigma factor (sigma-70 family)